MTQKVPSFSVIVTDYGTAAVGPLFAACYADLRDDLAKSTRSAAYRDADRRRRLLDEGVETLALVYWRAGRKLEVTP